MSSGPSILTVNAGSTSLKIALVRDEERLGTWDDLASAVAALEQPPDAVAHRFVHGGNRRAPALVDDDLPHELEGLVQLAPLHQPPGLAALDAARRALPDVPHVACFDTAFHQTVPAAAYTYALPARLRKTVRLYGFHGLSHAWSSGQVRELLPDAGRVLIAHLGGGASLCASVGGHSVDTTMGFTPMDGLVMATRSGSVDPGLLLWLLRRDGIDAAGLEETLDRRSGLAGLSGTDGDLPTVLEAVQRGEADAVLALDVYLHRLRREIGAMVASAGGLDVLVLTGGVGEHSELVRDRVTGWLSHLAGEVRVLVVEAREDLMIDEGVRGVLG